MTQAMMLGTPLSLAGPARIFFLGPEPLWTLNPADGSFQTTGDAIPRPAAAEAVFKHQPDSLACFESGTGDKVYAFNRDTLLCVDAHSGAVDSGFPIKLTDFFGDKAWPDGTNLNGVIPVAGQSTVWLCMGAVAVSADLATKTLDQNNYRTLFDVMQGLSKTSPFAASAGMPMPLPGSQKLALLNDGEILGLDAVTLAADGASAPVTSVYPNWPVSLDYKATEPENPPSPEPAPLPKPKPVPVPPPEPGAKIPPQILSDAKAAQQELEILIATQGLSVLNLSASYFGPLFKTYGPKQPTEPPMKDQTLKGKWTRFTTNAGTVTPEHVVWIYMLD